MAPGTAPGTLQAEPRAAPETIVGQPHMGHQQGSKRLQRGSFHREYKSDGQRAQIHVLEGRTVTIFSRNQEDNTGKCPDTVSCIPGIKLWPVTSFTLHMGAVAWDQEKKQIRSFQVLTTCKHKEVGTAKIQVQVCLCAFDLIDLNGESWVLSPFPDAGSCSRTSRRQRASLSSPPPWTPSTHTRLPASHNWLKLKKANLDSVGDPLDLLVTGAYLGQRKLAAHYGGSLLASYGRQRE